MGKSGKAGGAGGGAASQSPVSPPASLTDLAERLNPRFDTGDMVSIGDLRDRSGLSPEAFDKALLGEIRSGRINVHQYDRAETLTAPERARLFTSQGRYYNTVTKRR